MAYTKYSLTPANNNAAPPDGAPEGMLPSAVNDTMRDMMAQIRDCGDGIRGGTYTMTAPVITGGSINGAAIGGSSASTGKFSALTNTALTSGRITYAGTAGLLQDDADLTFDGSTLNTLNFAYTGTLTGGTDVVNLGSGQFYKDAIGRVGISVIPDSTWAIGTGVLQIGSSNPTSGGYLSNLSTGGFIALTQNLINIGGAYKYSGSSTGSLFYTQGGDYYWQSAPIGTAGATATLTTRMSLSRTGVLDVPNRGISTGSMPVGSVIQTVHFNLSSAFSTTSATDVSTGLTASITPTSSTSKILVMITANCRSTGTGGNAYFVASVYRNTSTQIISMFAQGGNFTSADFRSPSCITYLDEPATTSSTNYLFALNASLAGSGGVSMNNDGGTSTITLMEIAA